MSDDALRETIDLQKECITELRAALKQAQAERDAALNRIEELEDKAFYAENDTLKWQIKEIWNWACALYVALEDALKGHNLKRCRNVRDEWCNNHPPSPFAPRAAAREEAERSSNGAIQK